MYLLATDTSGKQGSIALARGQDVSTAVEVLEVVPLDGGTFSAQLVPQIAALLAKHRVNKHDIGAFAVASGPGSFTGLRIGLAAIKGLAEVLDKPIAAVSLLEVLALTSGLQGKVKAALDAGRGELYLGEYEIAGDVARMSSETLVARIDFPAWSPGLPIVTPDRNLAEWLATTGLAASFCGPLDAADVARAGWTKIRGGQTVPPDQLDANYVRRSDAEVFGKPRT
jgi:tRNA threonylcarbamoyladenosine biosynthesis protein TsaB